MRLKNNSRPGQFFPLFVCVVFLSCDLSPGQQVDRETYPLPDAPKPSISKAKGFFARWTDSYRQDWSHGSDQDGAQIRRWTGYGFDRLADEHGFAVAYPNGYEGYWNGCNIVGDYSANKLNIDDLGFLTAIVDERNAIWPPRETPVANTRPGSMPSSLTSLSTIAVKNPRSSILSLFAL